MLSDHERKELRELERRLADLDPDFPRTFDARARSLGRPGGGWPGAILACGVAALCVLLLVAGSPGGAVALGTVTAVIWLALRWRAAEHAGGPRDSDTSA